MTGKPFPAQSWRIEDGCLRAFDAGHGFQDLRTQSEFGKAFEFQFEWKIGRGGNSGVKYFVQKVDDWANAKGRQARARGFEYQLFDDAAEPTHDVRKITGSLYEAVPPMKTVAKPGGKFNRSMIRVSDGHDAEAGDASRQLCVLAEPWECSMVPGDEGERARKCKRGQLSPVSVTYSTSRTRFLRFRLRAKASLVRRFSPGLR